MNAGQQTTRRLASRAGPSICRSCRDSLSRSTYATAAAAVQTEAPAIQHIPPVASPSQASSYAINAGVVLSRPPQITRDLHPFESAFFLYQRRLNERLALPFTRYFYFKKRTPEDLEWKRKIKQRLTPARDIGRYKGYGDEAWNDELLVGARENEIDYQVERLIEDASTTGKEGEAESEAAEAGEAGISIGGAGGVAGKGKKVEHEPMEKPMPRVTEADIKGDVKSLNRLLPRTLYLLVKNKDGKWMFPQEELLPRETLHMAAERVLITSAGINMNTWVVGNAPIGHYTHDRSLKVRESSQNPNQLGSKTFFMKARIMGGQADITNTGLADFKWLAKEEVHKAVEQNYWPSIRNMLAER
ncbi:50S ribosomal subunit L30 [Lophiostoma macrostomum CBS 122681]|uniref:Large ribosomal subunit protein mL46 n=1 Tax=Lophiostoma macrostomum CBS 122681 TaxID=1314788 RepID=A0A6A6TE98_9PLEO|nr:50S ribosomal subunit L30 [Lophiostoma macrostomum CBS 122681]